MASVRGSQSAKQDPKTVNIRDKDDKSVMCGGDCGKVVKKSQQGLKCDGCGSWFHAVCGKCPEETYDFLNDHSEDPSIAWYCPKCVLIRRSFSENLLVMANNQESLESKVKELSETVNKKFEDLVRDLDMKFNKREIEQKSAEDSAQKKVEEKFDTLIDTVKNTIETPMASAVSEVMLRTFKEDQEELEEIRKRQTSIIIHGLGESIEENVEQRRQVDETSIEDLLHAMNCDKVSVSAVIRLGKRPDEPEAHPRALKLVVASEEQKNKILRQAKNLRGKKIWEKVFIHQDLTYKQRTARQLLVKQMKQRQEAGEKDLIIINERIVTKRKAQ